MAERAPKQPAEVRRRTILDAAETVFAASSYANADTGELAQAAGVKPAALYRYFASKRELYLATLESASPRLLGLWEEAGGDSENALDALWKIGMGYYDHTQSRSGVMRLWFQALSEASDPQVREAVGRTFVAAKDAIEATIERGKREGAVQPEADSSAAAWHFMAIGLLFDLLQLLGLEDEVDREGAKEIGQAFLDSIRVRAGDGGPSEAMPVGEAP